jgi:hypothetical protein
MFFNLSWNVLLCNFVIYFLLIYFSLF